MKNHYTSFLPAKSVRVVATFGGASLVVLTDGSLELRGGEPQDRTAAKEWISLFMHEAVPRLANR